jgi:four helix bundle protein
MMSKVERFEDLIAWQKARELTKAVFAITHERTFRSFALRDQMQRAVVSIMSNIAEGFERGGRGEFHQFLVIAKASCAEVRSQLYIAHDAGYIDAEQFTHLNAQAVEVSRILGGLRASVEKQWREQKSR